VNARSTPHTSRRLCVALSLLSMLPLGGCWNSKEAPVTQNVRPAYVAEVRAGAAESLGFVGEVRAARRAELAFAVSGRVSEVAMEPGDTVRRGQVLATLDTRPLAAQRAAAQAELTRVEAQRAEAQQRLERVRRALAGGAAGGGEIAAVQAEAAALEAAHLAASAQRDAAVWSLEQASLRAPMDGTVAMRLLEPGQVAGPGAPVMAIDGNGRELSMLLPASMAIQPGQTLALRSSSADIGSIRSEQHSRVLRVSGRLEAGGVRRVFLAVPAEATVGSTWVASIGNPQASPLLLVPLRAVLPDSRVGHGRVLRLARDGRTVESVEVKLGALHGRQVAVAQGLAAGDQVIVAGAAAIRPGSLVRPVAFEGDIAGVTP
jgi:RND family efflux transporter MFP subunit